MFSSRLAAGLINVRENGLRGDGVTDDTAALTKLVRDNLNKHKTLSFPAGTYLLRDSISWATDKGIYWPWVTWQGEGRGQTTIRLRDSFPADVSSRCGRRNAYAGRHRYFGGISGLHSGSALVPLKRPLTK